MASRKHAYLVGLLHEIHSVTFRLCDGEGEVSREWLREAEENPVGPSVRELLRQARRLPGWGSRPVTVQTALGELYLAFPLDLDDSDCLLAGPVLGSDISMNYLDAIMQENGWPIRHKPALMRHFREVPHMEYRALCRLGMLLWYQFHGEELDFFDFIERGNEGQVEVLQREIRHSTERAVIENRRHQFHHHSPHIENLIMDSIRQGDVTRLMNVIRDFPMDGSPGILSRGDPLRSVKNNVICMITLATRAAIAGGLHYEEAFTLSDQYIQQLEEMHSQERLFALSTAVYRELAERARAASSHGYSQAVEQCRAYMFRNLYMDVKLDELAQMVGMNKNRLITRFREETGLTPHQWMLRERIREAQRLLRTTDNSVTDISIALNFHDVSHFTKTFRKLTGASPLAWRKEEMEMLPVG